MKPVTRRDFLYLSLAASAGLARAAEPKKLNVHEQILDIAVKQQEQRRARFAAVKDKNDLEALQKSLRGKFLALLDGLPERSAAPAVKVTERIEGDDYTIDKLVFESLPDYWVPALLYRPKEAKGKLPAVLSPCGHSAIGKAHEAYQILHINLAKRGAVVLTYDPVGQGERSQYWEADKGRSRYNLSCGEHGVLGNPLYLLGTSLARYRIWDGMRGLDYLVSRDDVNPEQLGCVGSSGGGTLTSYISALDPRVRAAVPSCYITNLPRRMGNRIQRDPDADPEQDIYGFVAEGIDHAGLLALRAPRPTQVSAARLDFFPIEGARESHAEARKLYEVAGAAEAINLAEADGKHGLSQPLREAAYAWFDRWLHDRPADRLRDKEMAVKPRTPKELLVCSDGQVNISFKSRHLLPLAVAEFRKRKQTPRLALKDLLRLDPELADYRLEEMAAVEKREQTLIICVNGNETADWREEKDFLAALTRAKFGVVVLDTRGVGTLRPPLEVKGKTYTDPLDGVEENIAYNAFLVGKSLLGMRVTDVLAAVGKHKEKSNRLVLVGRRDAALVAAFAAAVEPAIHAVAVDEMLLSFWPFFEPTGPVVNAASLLPGLFRDFGDLPDVLNAIAPRKVLAAAPLNKPEREVKALRIVEKSLVKDPLQMIGWLAG
jgi:cephalosporin-C deacetylase-like acetyl esterase